MCTRVRSNVLVKVYIQALPPDLFKPSNLIFMLNFRGTVGQVGAKKHQPALFTQTLIALPHQPRDCSYIHVMKELLCSKAARQTLIPALTQAEAVLLVVNRHDLLTQLIAASEYPTNGRYCFWHNENMKGISPLQGLSFVFFGFFFFCHGLYCACSLGFLMHSPCVAKQQQVLNTHSKVKYCL